MNHAQARAIVQTILDPLPIDRFFAALGRGTLNVEGGAGHPRASIFGADPGRTITEAFGTHSQTLDCHAVTPRGPAPSPRSTASPDAFRALIGEYHDRDYTVRVPDVVPLSPELRQFARALEFLLGQPVTASVFWSKLEAKAKVHYDNNDIIVIQLVGRKRWYISTEPPLLHNPWDASIPASLAPDGHRVLEMGPGDLLYVPRGTSHSVDSLTESLHVSILFTPLTMRAAIIAALDHMSDLDRSFRETAALLHDASHGDTAPDLPGQMQDLLARLLERCKTPDFVEAAKQRRLSRFVGDLPALQPSGSAAAIHPSTVVEHGAEAICHLLETPSHIDFSQPGGHTLLHPGAGPALQFIADRPRFRVHDIPGLADEVRVALVERLVASGFLRVAG